MISGLVSLAIYYIITLIGSSPALSNIFQPQLNGLMLEILQYPQFYLMLMTVPFVCLLPDLTYNYGFSIFYPNPMTKIKFEQKKHPDFNYMEEQINHEVLRYLSGVIQKNRSVGQLTSKALDEIDRLSVAAGEQTRKGTKSIISMLNASPNIMLGTPG